MKKFITYVFLYAMCFSFGGIMPEVYAVQSINYDVEDATDAWTQWKSNYVTANDAGASPRLKVLGGVDDVTTVSEGQAYGILLASLFDDQETLDGLWLFAADHLTAHGLMHWHIGAWGNVIGSGAATDGDVDMAIGLITACRKVMRGEWSSSSNGLDYCALATDMVNAIYDHEVDHPGVGPAAGLDDNQGYELIPGDTWNLKSQYPDGIVNLSYFSPGYFRVFAEFTGNDKWYDVIDRQYELARLAKNINGNCSSLVPNWSKYNGQAQPVPWQPLNYDDWSYDAVRFAWRVAVDAHWYGDDEAVAVLDEIGGFFASVGIENVKAEYRLDGTAIGNFSNPLFTANAAAAIWGANAPIATDCGDATGTIQSTAQEAYDYVAGQTTKVNYFNDSWRVLTLALMTEQFPNPMNGTLDVNSDGIVSPTDAIFVINRQGDANAGAADVNDDGRVDETDVNAVIGSLGQRDLPSS